MDTMYLKLLLSIVLILISIIVADDNVEECLSISTRHSLPSLIKPQNYDISFVVKTAHESFIGTSNILIRVYNCTNVIRLHAVNIKIYLNQTQLIAINETTDQVKDQVPIGCEYCAASQTLNLNFKDKICPAFYYLKLNFVVYFKSKYKGFSQYQSVGNSSRFFTNLFSPNAARRMFPCWDDPEIKSTFNISVMHPARYVVLSNMQKLTSAKRMESTTYDQFQWTHFTPSPAMFASEVAIAMISNDMVRYTATKADIMWYYPKSTKRLRFARDTVTAVRTSLSAYTKQHIIPETRHIVIPYSPMKTAGSFGLVIYRESDIVYRNTSDFAGVQLKVTMLITAQIARQWFGETVSLSSRSDMWMSESFATYFSYSAHNENYKQMQELFVVQILQPTLHYDVSLRLKPLAHENLDPDEIDKDLYSRFYHNKGSVFLRMLQHFLDSDQIIQSIWQYVTKYKHGTTVHLWEILQGKSSEQEGINPHVRHIIDIGSQYSHYPELYVDVDDYQIHITPICRTGQHKPNLHIPISVFTQLGTSCDDITLEEIWMQCNISQIISKEKKINFVILNLLQIGYYRTNYENKNWQSITGYLQHEDYTCISVQNRAQLIDDAYYFVMTDKLDVAIFFNLIKYLKRETNYVVWYPIFNILSYMSAYWELPTSKDVKSIMLEILESLLGNIGYEERPKDDGMTKALRLLAAKWSCKFDHKECKEFATAKLLAKYSSKITILPWWEEWVYSMGMIKLNVSIWQKILHESTRNSSVYLLKYLPYTNDIVSVLNYIDFLRTNDSIITLIKDEELVKYHRFTLKRHIRRYLVLLHVLDNFENIADRFFQNDNLVVLWGDIIWNIYTANDINEVVQFSYEVDEKYSLSNKVDIKYSLEKSVINTIIRARQNYLNRTHEKFSQFRKKGDVKPYTNRSKYDHNKSFN